MTSKTKANTNTVKHPKAFDAEELKALQEAAVEKYLRLPGIKIFQVKSDFLRDACKLFAAKIEEGYQHAHAEYHNNSLPFAISLFKKEEELEAECEAVREEVTVKYKAEIAQQVEDAKSNLIAQRKAHFAKVEADKAKAAEDKLQADLEAEASKLFDQYLPE